MFGYKVVIDKKCDSRYHSGERYGDWEESYINTFRSVFKCNDKYPDVVSSEDFNVGDDVFVVWAEWSSGDSFGNGTNCEIEVLAVFSNIEDAKGFMIECKKGSDDIHEYHFTASTGQVFESVCIPWTGYFERLTDINIECAKISFSE